jgi:hypothetical protein
VRRQHAAEDRDRDDQPEARQRKQALATQQAPPATRRRDRLDGWKLLILNRRGAHSILGSSSR